MGWGQAPSQRRSAPFPLFTKLECSPDNTSMWIVYALIVTVTWGIGDVIAKKGLKKISPVWNNLLAIVFAVFGWVPFALSRGASFLTITPSSLLLACTIALLYLTYYYAIWKGKLILTVTLLSTYQATAFILSVVILREQNSFLQWIAVTLIIIGTFFISIEEFLRIVKNRKYRGDFQFSWLFWGFLGGIANGVGDFLSKIGVVRQGPYDFLLTLAVAYLLVNGFNAVLDKEGLKQSPFRYPQLFIFTFLGTGLVELGLIALSLAFEKGPASLVSPIASSSIVVTIILAALFLREKITRTQLGGVLATIIGIILVSIP